MNSILPLFVTLLLLTSCQAGEKPATNAPDVNSTAAVDDGADEQAI